LPGATPEESAGGFLAAVLDEDRSGVSRCLAGDRDPGAVGPDPWTEARVMTQVARDSWRSAGVRCTPAERVGSAATVDCELTSTGGDLLHLELTDQPGGRWTVYRAIGVGPD
jgi:hypothetical protein